MTFQEYLSTIDFLSLYNQKILPKKGGGRDNVTPDSYKKTFEKNLDWLRSKISDGSYKFSPYNEKLILKGRNKFPRVLSLPSVRDRFVLSVLHGYLAEQIEMTHMIPNIYIKKILEFIEVARRDGNEVYFFKTDIASFYDNINHSVLISTLADKIDGTAMKLVVKAITTATISGKADGTEINCKGVPQGLAISNILSDIYVEGFHNEMCSKFGDDLFLRYVDDIIVLSTKQYDFKKIITLGIAKFNLGLELTESKTVEGNIREGFDYIGYHVGENVITVKKKNRTNFTNRLVKKCSLLKKQFEDPSLRPRFVANEEEFLDYAEAEINLTISGFKINYHNYGWISYFQRVTDMTLLYQIDRVVKKCLGKDFSKLVSVNSIVDTYYSIIRRNGDGLLIDFDQVKDRGARIAYLKKFGYIKDANSEDISDTEIENLFWRMIVNFQKDSERDVAEVS